MTTIGPKSLALLLALTASPSVAARGPANECHDEIYGFTVRAVDGVRICNDRAHMDIHGFVLVDANTNCARDVEKAEQFTVDVSGNNAGYADSAAAARGDCEGGSVRLPSDKLGDLPLALCIKDKGKVEVSLSAVRAGDAKSPFGMLYSIDGYCTRSSEDRCERTVMAIARAMSLGRENAGDSVYCDLSARKNRGGAAH